MIFLSKTVQGIKTWSKKLFDYQKWSNSLASQQNYSVDQTTSRFHFLECSQSPQNQNILWDVHVILIRLMNPAVEGRQGHCPQALFSVVTHCTLNGHWCRHLNITPICECRTSFLTTGINMWNYICASVLKGCNGKFKAWKHIYLLAHKLWLLATGVRKHWGNAK